MRIGRLQVAWGKKEKGKVSPLDWLKARELAEEGKRVESVYLLLERAYGYPPEKVDKLTSSEVSMLLTRIEGIQQDLVCQHCGAKVEKLLCPDCVGFGKYVASLQTQMAEGQSVVS